MNIKESIGRRRMQLLERFEKLAFCADAACWKGMFDFVHELEQTLTRDEPQRKTAETTVAVFKYFFAYLPSSTPLCSPDAEVLFTQIIQQDFAAEVREKFRTFQSFRGLFQQWVALGKPGSGDEYLDALAQRERLAARRKKT